MKKWMVLLLAAMLAAIPVQGEESVSELLDPVDLSNTADWVECGDYIYDPNEADIDRNGKLNRRDCMILARYLAAWENISLDRRETE